MTEEKPCAECGSGKVEKYRKLCWSCRYCWKKHEMSAADWQMALEQKAKERQNKIRGICNACKRDTKYTFEVEGEKLCEFCNVASGWFSNEAWRTVLIRVSAKRDEAKAAVTNKSLPLGKR